MARHHFLTSRSRALRQNSTDAERKLWSVLRSRQHGGFKFQKQVENDGYVVDFVCPETPPDHRGRRRPTHPRTGRSPHRNLEGQGFASSGSGTMKFLHNLDGDWTTIEEALNPRPLTRPADAGHPLPRRGEGVETMSPPRHQLFGPLIGSLTALMITSVRWFRFAHR